MLLYNWFLYSYILYLIRYFDLKIYVVWSPILAIVPWKRLTWQWIPSHHPLDWYAMVFRHVLIAAEQLNSPEPLCVMLNTFKRANRRNTLLHYNLLVLFILFSHQILVLFLFLSFFKKISLLCCFQFYCYVSFFYLYNFTLYILVFGSIVILLPLFQLIFRKKIN